jgi:lipoprotein-anchoring transpeptidase ErfK/SrfK
MERKDMRRPFRRVPPLQGRWAGLLLPLLAGAGCDRASQDAAAATRNPAPAATPTQAGAPVLPKELARSSESRTEAPAPGESTVESTPAEPEPDPLKVPPDYKGPWFAVTVASAGVYSEPSFERQKKIGYLRNGGRIPVEAAPVSKKNCSGGWYKLLAGGFICGNHGTTNLNHPEVKFGTAAPNWNDVLPYPYARNAKNGTPLYKTVPSREQMNRYEPYLTAKTEAPKAEERVTYEGDTVSIRMDALLDAGAPPAAQGDPEPEKPWWQREDAKDRLHEVKLEHLEQDADDILAKRMVTGFYVAVDKTFRWNNRVWYRTTKGLVAPSDRFWQTAGSKFKGVELDGADFKLPVGWVYGGNKKASTYALQGDKLVPGKAIERFTAVQLTGNSKEIAKKSYLELADGTWVRSSLLRVTAPGPAPANLAPDERWVDVNLSTQTLVVFRGTVPVYATLISSGKESKIKEKDHRTPIGEWRIREKHVTATMDGDGSAAGDLPYSIEDVPYVMYYHDSYALHGAFWHANYGVQMSHGCVNLSPLDAKQVFRLTDPPLPEGWHGTWSAEGRPGSRVIVHE